MTNAMRRWTLRADGIFLMLFGGSGFLFDLRGYFTGVGAQARLTSNAPHTVIGFVEAHPSRSWHLTGFAVHLLLGVSNLVFGQIFVAAEILPLGYGGRGIKPSCCMIWS